MADNPELKEFLVRIYELLRIQHQTLFELSLKMQSLETALNTNKSFAELLLQAREHVQNPEVMKAYQVGLSAIDELIAQLRGKESNLN